MANARLNPDSFYVPAGIIPASYFQGLDGAQTAGLDGDAGGTWAPSGTIEIFNGAGMWCAGTWTLSPPSHGTVQVFLSNNTTSALTHGDSDYITLASGHSLSTRFLQTQISLGKDASGCPTLQVYTAPGGGQAAGIMGPTAVMVPVPPTSSAGSAGYGMANCPIASYPYRPGGRIVAPLSVHNGSTIDNVTVFFTISSAHTAEPDVLPQFRVHKVDIAGNLTPLNSTTPNGSGFLEMPWPGSVATYKTTTFFVYTCDLGVVIDTSTYSYFVEIIDESGTNAQAGNVFTSAEPFYYGITDMRPQ